MQNILSSSTTLCIVLYRVYIYISISNIIEYICNIVGYIVLLFVNCACDAILFCLVLQITSVKCLSLLCSHYPKIFTKVFHSSTDCLLLNDNFLANDIFQLFIRSWAMTVCL